MNASLPYAKSSLGKGTRKEILVIEDIEEMAEPLVHNLTREGYDVVWKKDGVAGLRYAREKAPDLILLDLMLPLKDGIEVCRDLRSDAQTRHVPIIMLTAKSDEIDQVVGFSVGADDYVTKPYSIKVLTQRIRVLLQRRAHPTEAQDRLERHGIVVDRVAHQVTLEGVLVNLTRTEFRLLEALMRYPGRAYSRNDLLASAVGDETIVLERTIDVHIRSLRQKLGERAARAIETVRGVGYRFARELSDAAPDDSE